MALHRADVLALRPRLEKKIPMPFGMMPVSTQKDGKFLDSCLKVQPYALMYLAVEPELLTMLAVAQLLCAQMD